MARIMKQHNNYVEAVQLWKTASSLNDFDSMIELAKYYEHKEKNIQEAIYYTNLAASTVKLFDERFNIQSYQADLKHRLDRLKRKLEKL